MTSDISPNWLNVIRRLQSVSRTNNGAAVISINVVIDQDGIPVYWTEPNVCKIEPMTRANDFLQLLVNGRA